MPIYGRAFHNTHGPGKHYEGIGAPEKPCSWEAGVWDYKALPIAGATEYFDPTVGASWSHDPVKKMVISYDTKEAAGFKASYIAERGLGGAMWWEASADKKGDQSLICTVRLSFPTSLAYMRLMPLITMTVQVATALGGSNCAALDRCANLLNYPDSKYDNLRNQFPHN